MYVKPKKLLDTSQSNTKILKTNKKEMKKLFPNGFRIASLSMMPDAKLCPWSKNAGCFDLCLKTSGRALMFNAISIARQNKTDYYHADQTEFLTQLRKELTNFEKLCIKTNIKPVVRLNVYSDIQWERHNIPQDFPNIYFYDYTKQAQRLGKLPENYKLVFSYSGKKEYQPQVKKALKHNVPIAVVFYPRMPSEYMGRKVIDGDQSDLVNMESGKVIIGLKYKRTKASNDEMLDSDFVINPSIIATG